MIKKFHVNHTEDFANFMKTLILTYCAPFQGKKQPENMDPRVHDLHTHESSSDIPAKQVSWSYNKNFWENGRIQTPCKFLTFTDPKIHIHNFFEFETWLHPFSQYVAVGSLFAQLEWLWNGLHTAIRTDHELFHSLNIYNTNLNFELFGVPKWPTNFTPLGPSFYTLTIVAPLKLTKLLKVSSESIGIISSKLTYLGPIWKNWPTGAIIHT